MVRIHDKHVGLMSIHSNSISADFKIMLGIQTFCDTFVFHSYYVSVNFNVYRIK